MDGDDDGGCARVRPPLTLMGGGWRAGGGFTGSAPPIRRAPRLVPPPSARIIRVLPKTRLRGANKSTGIIAVARIQIYIFPLPDTRIYTYLPLCALFFFRP